MNCYVKLQFDPAIAKEHGVEEAIMLANIEFWCMTNKKNKQNFYEGKYWMYNSQETFSELFVFWTRRQIQRILKNLVGAGLVIEGNFNKVGYDKTKWYSVTAINEENTIVKENLIEPHGASEATIRCIRSDEVVQPIPDNKTDSKPIVLIESCAFDQFWEEYPKKELKVKARAIWNREKLDKYLQQILVFIESAKKTDRWKKGFIKQPTAFLNGRCWEDDLGAYGQAEMSAPPGIYKSKSGLKIPESIKV